MFLDHCKAFGGLQRFPQVIYCLYQLARNSENFKETKFKKNKWVLVEKKGKIERREEISCVFMILV